MQSNHDLEPTFTFNQNAICFVLAMKALGYRSNTLGICYGLSYSARDAFLAGEFEQFNQMYQAICTLYKSVQSDTLQEMQLNYQHLFQQKNASHSLVTLQRNHFFPNKKSKLEVKHDISEPINLGPMLIKHAWDPHHSTITPRIQSHFAQMIDVVTQTKLNTLIDWMNDNQKKMPAFLATSINEKLSQLSQQLFSEKKKTIETQINTLSLHAKFKQSLNVKIQNALKTINPEQLLFFHQVSGFCERIELYQQANLYYADHFEPNKAPLNQDGNATYPLVETQKLQDLGGITSVLSFAGTYTESQLSHYFQSLRETLHHSKTKSSLVLTNIHHAIMIGYDPSTDVFTLIDANKSFNETPDASILAQQIMSSFLMGSFFSRPINVYPILPTSFLSYPKDSYYIIQSTLSLYYVDSAGLPYKLSLPDTPHYRNLLQSIQPDSPKTQDAANAIYEWILQNEEHARLHPKSIFMTSHLSVLTQTLTPCFYATLFIWFTLFNEKTALSQPLRPISLLQENIANVTQHTTHRAGHTQK